VQLANGRQLNNAGLIEFESSTTIGQGSGAAGRINNTGTIRRAATAPPGSTFISVELDNDGLVESLSDALRISGTLINYNAATDTLTGGTYAARGAQLRLPDVVSSNAAHLVLDGVGAQILVPSGNGALDGLDVNEAAGRLEIQDGADLTVTNLLRNAGTVRLQDNSLLTTTGGVDYRQTGGLTVLEDAGTQLTATGALVDIQGGRLEGVGTVGPSLRNAAEVRPGTSPGILNVSGTYTQTAAGTLRSEIGGATPGTQHDRLVVTGTAVLAGTLAGDTINGFAPAEGSSFQVVTCSPCTGGFGSVTSTGLPSGLAYVASQSGSAVNLVVAGGDVTPPTTSIIGGPSGSTEDHSPTFEFNASEAGSSFECSVDGGPFTTCNSPFTTPELGPGSHTFSVRARDAAGNVGPATTFTFTVVAITIDKLPPPTLGEEVNIGPVPGSGPVLIAVPAGSSAARARASQKGLTFVPLTEARQIPTGSFLDTTRGTVQMQSATGRGQRVQSGKFSAGLFQVLQSRARRARGLTELRLKGGSFRRCGGRASRTGDTATAALSRRVVRRLRANARGRFQTRGNNSAATVRSTIWTTTDRCDGTLTQVRRGTVVVRDFRRKKNVVVRAGKSYFARARG
jgi:hypothetical protein